MKSIFLYLCLLHLVFGVPFRKLSPIPVPNTPENIAIIKSGNYKQNIEELSGQFEGDMVLTTEQELVLKGLGRTGLIETSYRWPNNTVPYTLSNVFRVEQKIYIELAMREIESLSCVLFVPRTTEANFVSIENGSGCSSNVGHLGRGQQVINLQSSTPGEGCFRVGTIIHEMLHTLGFYHMQSATERDEFVTIMWQHIQAGMENNFSTYQADRISNFGVGYDVTSVMHYSAWGFTKNGFATIVPHDITLINVMGQRAGMSDKDISRLRTMYNC